MLLFVLKKELMTMEQEMEMAVRPVDELGRIVLPFELRQMLDFQAKENVRISKKRR